MPQPPTSSGMPPNEVTASTIVSAPCSRAIAASSRTGFSTPVDVSACTIATTSAGVAFELRAAARRDRTPCPTRTSSARHRRAVALAHLREAIAEVAGDDDDDARARRLTRFATAVSIPDVPVPDTANANDPSGARNSARQPRADVVEQRDHQRIEMADASAPPSRASRAATVRLGTGPEQDAIGIGQQAHAGDLLELTRALRAARRSTASGSGSERRPRQRRRRSRAGSAPPSARARRAARRAAAPPARAGAAARPPRRGGRRCVSSNSRTHASGSTLASARMPPAAPTHSAGRTSPPIRRAR